MFQAWREVIVVVILAAMFASLGCSTPQVNVTVTTTTQNVTVGMHSLTAERIIAIPATGGFAGQTIIVKLDSTGATYPVQVTAGGTTTIDNLTAVLVSGAYATLTLHWTGISALGWSTVG